MIHLYLIKADDAPQTLADMVTDLADKSATFDSLKMLHYVLSQHVYRVCDGYFCLKVETQQKVIGKAFACVGYERTDTETRRIYGRVPHHVMPELLKMCGRQYTPLKLE